VRSGELVDEPGVDGPEGRAGRVDVALADQPLDLRAGEVGVEHEPGALAHERLTSLLAELVAAGGGAAVLPHERAVERVAGLAVPGDDRLALVGDPDRR
jgi:hypothetical protein